MAPVTLSSKTGQGQEKSIDLRATKRRYLTESTCCPLFEADQTIKHAS